MDNYRLDNASIGRNVRRARSARDLDLKDVSAALAELGHPLGVSALSKLETNGRKILAEDLAYLAAVLGVSPNVLLLGDGTQEDGPTMDSTINVAGKWDVALKDAWRWVQGEQLPRTAENSRTIRTADLRVNREFRARSRPHDPPVELSIDDYRQLQDSGVFDGLTETARQLGSQGFGLDVARQHLDAMKTMADLGDALRAGGGGDEPPTS